MPQGLREHPAQVKRFLTSRRVWAVLILVIGLGIMFFYGTRTLSAYREFEYARTQGLLNGTASVDAIKPWMTIRYIAVAYAVPEEYLYAQLGVPYQDRPGPRHDSLGEVARRITPNHEPKTAIDGVITQLRTAILEYRENPVAPGLRDIRLWMSIAYITNSTGVPAAYLVEQIEASLHTEAGSTPTANQAATLLGDNMYKPLIQLVEDLAYPGGPKALEEIINTALEAYEALPAQEQP